jgi:predicted nucleic acid-binding Zn ribbon protein
MMTEDKWIVDGHHYTCPNCKKTIAIVVNESDEGFEFCPFCGKRMSGQTTDGLSGYGNGYSDGRIDILRELRQSLDDKKDLSAVKDIIDDKIKDWEENNAEIRKERKYRCQIWLTREVSFYVKASCEKVAKAILERIAAEKKKPGEEVTSKYIHEVCNK